MIGDRIKIAREAKGLSRRKLCDMIGVSNSYISQIEKGPLHDMGATVLGKISEMLDVSCDWLILGKEVEKPRSELTSIEADLLNCLKKCNPHIQANVFNLIRSIADSCPEGER